MKGNGKLPPLNGVSIDNISVNQDGDLEVTFDLPVEQSTACYQQGLQGTRSFDLYEHPELQKICRELFRAVRKKMRQPDPQRLEISCDDCKNSSCCRNYNVLVTEFDVRRLVQGLEIPENEFRRRYLDTAIDWCGDYRHQLTCDEDEDGEKCVFLKRASSGQMRCSVYEHRPQICRDFDVHTCEDFVPMEEVKVLGKAQ